MQQTATAAAAFLARPVGRLAASVLPSRPATSDLDVTAIRFLAAKISGRVITPDATDYDSARIVFNRAFDQHPAVIVRCADATDVARALEFSRSHNLPLAVRGGGHSRAGFSTCEGGVVIDLSQMNQVTVDTQTRSAHAEAGCLVRDMDTGTQRSGLATTMGGCPTVGIASFTIGGGEGLLMSKFGAGCDNLVSAQLVTVDGRHIEASRNANPDLFWAIRGGGGNFGIVTSLEYKLHPLTDVLSGVLAFPPGRVPDLLQAFAKFLSNVPDEMNVVGVVSPSEQGARFHVMVCHCGSERDGNDLLKPLRAFKPQQDNIHVTSYLETQSTINPYSPAAHFQTDLIVPTLSSEVLSIVKDAIQHAPPNTRLFIVPIYGAITRVPANDTAFPIRQVCCEIDIMGRWSDPADKPVAIQWVKDIRDKLKPHSLGVYSNQLGETSEELVRSAYGPNYARLAALKKKYDPDNVLKLNQNIKPS